ncbi:DUF6036 family nucleotidyltransferase [Vulgatibacter sp.]|uniref:DUF6036 family nucleotidyltransferase n=1 Tax=Vulgatibacter sp. TaxID=1971226 RepID=UPI00356B2790
MKQYSSADLEELLRRADARLSEPEVVVLVGGAVVGLVHGSSHATKDLDYVDGSSAALLALAEVGAEMGIPIQNVAGIYCAPHDWEDRRTEFKLAGLSWLRVFVPEKHDFAMMKLARGTDHDIDAIVDIHSKAPFAFNVLCARFRDTQVLGDGIDFKYAFAATVERLFGIEAALAAVGEAEQ